MKEFEFTPEQIQSIAHCIRTTIRTNQEAVNNMLEVCGSNEYTIETAKNLTDANVRLTTLLNYIEQK